MLLIILCLFSIGHKKDSVASQMQDQKLQDGSFTELPRKLLQWYTIILICTQCFLFSSIVANYFSSSSAAGPHILMTARRSNTIMIYTKTTSFRKNAVYLRSKGEPGASGRVLPPVTGRSRVRVVVSSHCTGEGKACN